MEIILKYFPHLTEKQRQQFAQLFLLYGKWNEKINLVSRKDIDNLYERHILHSLGIAKIIDFPSGTRVMDIGTGGGFPGIPLAILFPNTQFHLVDSIGKKLKVVADVTENVGLANVKITHARVEDIEGTYDFFVNRAVANLNKLHQWVGKKVKKKTTVSNVKAGIISLKGGDLEQEIADYGKKVSIHALSDYFEEEFFETKKVLYAPLSA